MQKNYVISILWHKNLIQKLNKLLFKFILMLRHENWYFNLTITFFMKLIQICSQKNKFSIKKYVKIIYEQLKIYQQ